MPSSKFVTAWAATQSQMFLVRTIRPRDKAEPDERGQQFAGVHQHGNGGANHDGETRHLAEGHFPEVLVDNVAHQEAAEEELFDDRHDRARGRGSGWRGTYKPRLACPASSSSGLKAGRSPRPRIFSEPEWRRAVSALVADGRCQIQSTMPTTPDDDRQRRDAKRKLPIAGQHEEHRRDRERDLDRVDDRVVAVLEPEPILDWRPAGCRRRAA